MKKKLTLALIIGFVSLIAGLILAGIGFFTGGMTRLEEVAAPTEVHKTFTDLNTIKIDFIPHSVYIKESSDNNYHVTYANSDNNIQKPLKLSEKDGVLTLSAQELKFAIEGIMQYLGERLAQRDVDVNYVTIEIPKGETLNKLEGYTLNLYSNSTLELEDVHIKEINITGSIYMNGSQIDSGHIQTNSFNSFESTLKNLEISGSDAMINLSGVTLENVKIEDYYDLSAIEATFKGNNILTPSKTNSYNHTRLDLTEQSLQDINLAISTQFDLMALAQNQGYYAENEKELEGMMGDLTHLEKQFETMGIHTRGVYEKLSVKKEDRKQSLTLENKSSKNSLTIDAVNATIAFEESK
ncbi:DUF4097 domain-containing protein [Streptococcus suis]|uniref:DUF4097 family beta strand repeat-containing protein n=1 Tax=Streptococcus suis TaxID=1307 RepID=UPI0024122DFD|nr:DUF4097 family beta strand repeat-containing protein [Streptococcus suis]MDG4506165.1 DUF4097 domain-containing protein [Streptococcus suis]HEM2825109.1 DUF4097 family beta strand repeat protein [Streptococcus suis]HEM4403309.1 DUF4097 family beta strand repeat protein [Streptococcus suis]